MKKFFFTITLALLLSISTNSKAQASTEATINTNLSLPCKNFDELENLPIEETYTYEEIIADMLNNGIHKDEISKFKSNHTKTVRAYYTEEIRYSKFTMDSYAFSKFEKGHFIIYRLTPVFYGGLLYRNGHYEPVKLVSLEGGHVKTSDGASCVFGGSMFYALEAGNRFYYGVYGDVYRTGTITISAGARIGIGESSFLTISFSYCNDYLTNVDFEGRYESAGLEP